MSKHILEVFDYRLSTVQPIIYREKTWVVKMLAQDDRSVLERWDSEIETEEGDTHNDDKLSTCFDYIKSVRDKYSRDNIEELKPLVKALREKEAIIAPLRQEFDDKVKAALGGAK